MPLLLVGCLTNEVNRRAGEMLAEDQGVCRRVRLTVRLGVPRIVEVDKRVGHVPQSRPAKLISIFHRPITRIFDAKEVTY
jgi:hypothetical protein